MISIWASLKFCHVVHSYKNIDLSAFKQRFPIQTNINLINMKADVMLFHNDIILHITTMAHNMHLKIT